MDLSIIIPTFARRRQVLRLLGSIRRQWAPPEFEAIVVSNLEDLGLKRDLAGYDARFRLLSSGKIGVNRARNFGVEAARGDILLFLDDDCFIDDPFF